MCLVSGLKRTKTTTTSLSLMFRLSVMCRKNTTATIEGSTGYIDSSIRNYSPLLLLSRKKLPLPTANTSTTAINIIKSKNFTLPCFIQHWPHQHHHDGIDVMMKQIDKSQHCKHQLHPKMEHWMECISINNVKNDFSAGVYRLVWMTLENNHHHHHLLHYYYNPHQQQQPLHWIHWTGKHCQQQQLLETLFHFQSQIKSNSISGTKIPGLDGYRSFDMIDKQHQQQQQLSMNFLTKSINATAPTHTTSIPQWTTKFLQQQQSFSRTMMMVTSFCTFHSNSHGNDGSNDHCNGSYNILDTDDEENDGNPIKNCWKCDKPIMVFESQQNTNAATNGSHMKNQNHQEEQKQAKEQVSSIGEEKKIIKDSANGQSWCWLGSIVCPHCKTIQPLPKDVNYYHLFNINQNEINNINSGNNNSNNGSIKHQTTPSSSYMLFDIDLNKLHQNYLRLQQYMHPDMNINRSNNETDYSSDNASIINDAYKILRDPYQRALYLLGKVYNIHIDEVNVDSEPELLLEIMELNEEVELATDKASVDALLEQVKETISQIVEQMKQVFDEDHNGSEARKLAIKYSYYNTVLDKLKSKI